MKEHINLGRWTDEGLDVLLNEAAGITSPGERIAFLSGHFLKTEYKESTLIGDVKTPEVFVINLESVDCFTFIEYIEAMRLSNSFVEFRENLRNVRYKSGVIAFTNRNHFFTDWREFNSGQLEDVTEMISYANSHKVIKQLNRKGDGTFYLSGIPVMQREIAYIHSDAVDDEVIDNMNTGDYVGMYSKEEGLDVSHTGIIIMEKDRVRLRHASSLQKHRRVLDEDFRKYLKAKPGIIVLRPRG